MALAASRAGGERGGEPAEEGALYRAPALARSEWRRLGTGSAVTTGGAGPGLRARVLPRLPRSIGSGNYSFFLADRGIGEGDSGIRFLCSRFVAAFSRGRNFCTVSQSRDLLTSQ